MAHAADAWPARPVRFIVPFPPGGPVDTTARAFTQKLGEIWQQPNLVDNRAGAGGMVGAALAAKEPADGYTLFVGSIHHAVNPALQPKMTYDIERDFAPVSFAAMFPVFLVAHPSVPASNVRELIALAKSGNGLSFGSSGNGGGTHLAGELFNMAAGTQLRHIPYKGSAPAMNDLLANQVGIMFDNLPSAMPHVKAGKLRPLAVTSAQRYPELPDVPTIAEAGVPGYEATSWFGLFTNKAVPAPIVQQLNAAIVKVLAKPEVVAQMKEQGAIAHPETPAQFEAFIKAETAKWGKVVRDSGATAD
jgi:tripartite-type tricarboxylate transporter receptor subunit TctC